MEKEKKKKFYSPEEALAKAMSYCAYQERSHSEVRTKLLQMNVFGKQLEEIMSKLIEDNFLNEERFAVAFAGGKFRIKKWGHQKIKQALKMKGVSDYCIDKALKKIGAVDYKSTFQKELKRKMSLLKKGLNAYEKKTKVAQYLIGRGYEPEMVWNELRLDEE